MFVHVMFCFQVSVKIFFMLVWCSKTYSFFKLKLSVESPLVTATSNSSTSRIWRQIKIISGSSGSLQIFWSRRNFVNRQVKFYEIDFFFLSLRSTYWTTNVSYYLIFERKEIFSRFINFSRQNGEAQILSKTDKKLSKNSLEFTQIFYWYQFSV